MNNNSLKQITVNKLVEQELYMIDYCGRLLVLKQQ